MSKLLKMILAKTQAPGPSNHLRRALGPKPAVTREGLIDDISNRVCYGVGPIKDGDMARAIETDDHLFNLMFAVRAEEFARYLNRKTGMPIDIIRRLYERDKPAWTSAVMNGGARRWESLRAKFNSRLVVYQKNKQALGILSDMFPDRTGFLDVGCGMGFTMMAAMDLGYTKAHGLEVDPNFSSFGTSIMPANFNGKMGYVAGDFLEEPCAPPYSLITFFDVLEHIASAGDAISRAVSMLSDDGVAYFYQGNSNALQMVRSEPHYRVPLMTLMPKDLAINVLLRLGKIKNADEYVVNEWPSFSVFEQVGVAGMFPYPTNIRTGQAYLTEAEGEKAIRAFPILLKSELRAVLEDSEYSMMSQILDEYTARFFHTRKHQPSLFVRDFLMSSWNVVVVKTASVLMPVQKATGLIIL